MAVVNGCCSQLLNVIRWLILNLHIHSRWNPFFRFPAQYAAIKIISSRLIMVSNTITRLVFQIRAIQLLMFYFNKLPFLSKLLLSLTTSMQEFGFTFRFVCVASYVLLLWIVALSGLCVHFRWKKCSCKATFVLFLNKHLSWRISKWNTWNPKVEVVSRTCACLH